MSANTWVKVVGFDDMERHSLNTLFRLSVRASPSYALWTPEAPSPPQVALLDMDSYEAGLELASPHFNPNLNLICVGAKAPAHARRTFTRPVDWNAMVRALDELFSTESELDFDLDSDGSHEKVVPPGVKVALVVGLSGEERLYLRARMALGGITDLDEVNTATQATDAMAHRHYDLVVVSLELSDADPWGLVQSLRANLAPPRTVVVATHAPSWAVMERAEQEGCAALLEVPFNPPQLLDLLHMV